MKLEKDSNEKNYQSQDESEEIQQESIKLSQEKISLQDIPEIEQNPVEIKKKISPKVDGQIQKVLTNELDDIIDDYISQENLNEQMADKVKKDILKLQTQKILKQTLQKTIVNFNTKTINLTSDKFIQDVKEKFSEFYQSDQGINEINDINKFLQQVVDSCKENTLVKMVQMNLKKMHQEIINKNFSWDNYEDKMDDLNAYFSIFESLAMNPSMINFLNIKITQELFPLEFIVLFFDYPPYYVKQTSYDKINDFYCNIIRIIHYQYFLEKISLNAQIYADNVSQLDPFMRNLIRIYNINEYQNKFGDFSIYNFIYKIIDDQLLTINPKLNPKTSTPFILTLLELIQTLYTYGIFTFFESKKLLSLLFQVSEIIENFEYKASFFHKEKFSNEEILRILSFLKNCREIYCKIIIHHIILSCDITLYDYLKTNKNFSFSNFIFKLPASFTFLANITIKYLSSYRTIFDESLQTSFQKEALQQIYYFIGDYNDDMFLESLTIVKEKLLNEYMKIFKQEKFIRLQNQVKTQLENLQNQLLSNQNSTSFIQNVISLLNEETQFLNLRKQIILTFTNIPAYVLKILCLILDKNHKKQFSELIIIFKKLITNFYPSQSVLFRGQGSIDFNKIILRKNLDSMMLMKDIFIEDQSLLYISPNIFLFNFTIYNHYLKKLKIQIEQNKPDLQMKTTLGALFLYNSYFINVMEDHQVKIKRKRKFHLMVTHEIQEFFFSQVFAKIFLSSEMINNENLKLDFNVNDYRLENIHTFKSVLLQIDTQDLLFQFFFSLLKVFNKSCYKEYSGKIYEHYSNKILEVQKREIYQNPQILDFKSLKIFYEKSKFFDRFEVMANNHVITNRKLFKNTANLVAEQQFIQNPDDFFFHQQQQSQFIDNYLNKPQLNNQEIEFLQKVFFKIYFASLFKHAQAHKIHIHSIVANPHPTMIPDFILKTYEAVHNNSTLGLKEFNATLNDDNPYKNFFIFTQKIFNFETLSFVSQSFYNKKAEFIVLTCFYLSEFYFQSYLTGIKLLQKFLNKIGNSQLLDDTNVLELKTIYENYIKVSENFQLKQHQQYLIEIIDEMVSQLIKIYKKTDFYYIISRYMTKVQFNEYTSWMHKMIRYSTSLCDVHKQIKVIPKNKNFITSYSSSLIVFKKLYKSIKMKNNHQLDDNNFLQTIISKKEQGLNLRNVLWYFIEEINQMDLNFDDDNFENQFFFNSNYIFQIVNLDNLMQWRGQIRDQLFQEIQEFMDGNQQKEKIIKAFHKISQANYITYKIALYKTFQDSLWDEYYSMYLILQNFLDNLISNNNVGFKQFLSNINYPGAMTIEGNQSIKKSMFFEFYMMMEVSASESPFWLNQKSQIVIEEQPHIFLLIKRVIESVTKNLTGPMLTNQLQIYTYRTDIWNGILNRVVDDLDSPFYQVKNSVLQYYLAMLEGLDNTIVSYLYSNFDLEKFYKQILSLTIKLLISQIKKDRNKQNQKINISQVLSLNQLQFTNIVTDQEAKFFVISHESTLLDFYKKKGENFGNHLVLKIIINFFILIKNMAFKIKFYELFLKEKDQSLKDFKKGLIPKNMISQKKRNEFLIYEFLEEIVEDIEIVYQSPNGDQFLQKLFFRKNAESFFLNFIRKEQFELKMNISSEETKQRDLFSQVIPLGFIMKEQQKLFERFGYFYQLTTEELFQNLHYVLYMMSIFINILMLIGIKFEHTDDQNVVVQGPSAAENGLERFIDIMGILIIIFSFIFSCQWLYFRRYIKTEMKYLEMVQQKAKIKTYDKLANLIVGSLFMEARFRALYLHFLFSLGGLLWNYFFYTLNLILVANLSRTLNYVMMSIVRHWGKFMITLLITIIVILFYSFLMMNYYNNQINIENFDQDTCKDYVGCFLNSINFGLRLGGGIADPFQLQADPNDGAFWGRFFVDITFFFIIKMVFLNLIAGIIIDTFGDMRDEMNMRDKDAKTICFICGLSKWQVEKKGQEFKKHINHVHEKWQYLYFMSRLEGEDKANLSGFETYIYNKYQKDDTSWFPKFEFLEDHQNMKKLEKS